VEEHRRLGFLCAEFWFVGCFPRCSIHCVNVIRSPLLLFHLKEHVNNMYWYRKSFLNWYSLAPLPAGADLLHVNVFHEHVYGEHCMKTTCTHFIQSVCKIYKQGTVSCVLNIVTGYVLVANCFHYPFKVEPQAALFKAPVRTAL
jgi:hypothetical protein